jgi:hypothetical protein
LLLAIGGSTLIVLLFVAIGRLDPVPLGLTADYFPNATFSGSPVSVGLDAPPSTDHILSHWNDSPPDTFSARWSGAIAALREGTYAIEAQSDGDITLVLDGQTLGEKTGGQPAIGSVRLTPGAHQLLIHYVHRGGPVRFALRWARDRDAPATVPAWALRPRRIRSVAWLAARMWIEHALAISEWVWVGLLVLAAASLARAGLARTRGQLERATDWPALKWILAASLVLDVVGLGWGLPGTWVAIEMKPQYVLGALASHFSHGWYDAYPPVHFYVLVAAWSPLLLLSALNRLTFDSSAAYSLLVAISRLVSVAMAAGMVAAACVCGTRAFGRRAGLVAAAIFALAAPFVYYAKTANVDVPYLFWWALSMVFYLRLLDTGATSDYLAFASTATLAVCTKDQAYGLYLLPPLVIVERIWRENRRARVPGAWWRAFVDRRLVLAALASAALFAVCQNLIFNAGGFMDHVRFITGPGSAAYRVYEPTIAGRLALLEETIRLIQESMGWPLFVAGTIGLLLAIAEPRHRRMTVWLLVPVVSYYLGFIDVILYNYDRFVLPMCFVLAIFGGFAFDRILSSGLRAWGRAALAGALAYTLLYSATVDVLMVRDSRYDAERWMAAHARRDDIVGVSGLHEYLPRLEEYRLEDIGTMDELRQERPRFVVLNADYARAVPGDSPWGEMIAGLERGTIGYRLAGRFRSGVPWPWLPGGHPDLVGARRESLVFSTLRNINPTIEIFERER